MNGIIKFALEIAHMSDAEIADLSAKMPAFGRLAADAKELEPILTQAEPLIAQLEPLVAQAWPIVQKAWPDVVAVTPTVQQLIEFVNSKGE